MAKRIAVKKKTPTNTKNPDKKWELYVKIKLRAVNIPNYLTLNMDSIFAASNGVSFWAFIMTCKQEGLTTGHGARGTGHGARVPPPPPCGFSNT